MKALFKYAICLATVVALLLCFSSFAFASEADEVSAIDAEVITNNLDSESVKVNTGIRLDTSIRDENASEDNPIDENESPVTNEGNSSSEATVGGEGTTILEENPFSLFFETVSSYSSELLSALAFIGSIILAFCYKKGLMPLVENTLSAIAKAVGGIREKAEATESKSRELCDTLTKRLEAAEGVIAQLGEAITNTSKTLDAYESAEGERASMKIVLSAQIDMLYDIFMTSSLPQYQKDAVGERISKMKEALSIYEGKAV